MWVRGQVCVYVALCGVGQVSGIKGVCGVAWCGSGVGCVCVALCGVGQGSGVKGVCGVMWCRSGFRARRCVVCYVVWVMGQG